MDGFRRRSEMKRDSIRRAALELFKTHGFRKVTINEIASRAGVSPVTIYNYFGSKEGLVREVVKSVFDEGITRYQTIASSGKPFLERLDQIMFQKSQILELFGGELTQTALKQDPEMQAWVESLWQKSRPLMAQFYEEGRREGYIKADISFEAFMLYWEIMRRGFYSSRDILAQLSNNPGLMRELQTIFIYGPIERKGWA
ncbi:MAG: TetR/AcrR family transcriptional regulator [Chloroflexota bacterium]